MRNRTIIYVLIILAVGAGIWYYTAQQRQEALRQEALAKQQAEKAAKAPRPEQPPGPPPELAIGKAAPEITGEDIDGKPLKLSDYKGKVVVLDFWGNW
jgi:hypothetical protein